MCTTQFSHGSVWSLWSYCPLILQKWAKNVNKVNNFFSFLPMTCCKYGPGVAGASDTIFARVIFVIAELWPFNIARWAKYVST